LSQTDKWEDYFSFYTLYPKVFLPIEGFFSSNLGLTFGVWALFFMAKFSQIAKELCISDKTAKARYLFLLNNKYIKDVQAMYKPESIGLKTYTHFLKVRNFSEILLLEKLSDFHNFTVYRNRIYGKFNGLLLQFNIPLDSLLYLDALFLKLKDLNIISDFLHISSENYKIRTKPEMRFYDNAKGCWI